MIRFEKLAPFEVMYPFEDAVAAEDYKNGTMGTVEAGTFTAGTGFKAIMQIEKGDDLRTDAFKVLKDEHVRVADLAKADGQVVNITADSISGDYADAKYFDVDEKGMLKKAESLEGNGFTVLELTRYGARAVVTVAKGE